MGLQVQKVFLMIFICYSPCGESAVTLSSSLDSVNHIACPNETIYYECVTSGTSLTWKSIATNFTIQFIMNEDTPGMGKGIDDESLGRIVAQFLSIDQLESGLYTLNSTLRIDVPPGIFNTTISCFDEDENTKSLTYTLSDTPSEPIFNAFDQETLVRLSDQNVTFRLTWNPPSNMDMFTLYRYEISYFNATVPVFPTQKEYSLTVPIIGNANSITVGITAVSRCGQRSETSMQTICIEDCGSTGCRLESFMTVTIILFCFGFINLIII